jgi:membrane protein
LGAIVITGASLLFRFGPYRPRARLRWATPGATLATVLWVAATAGFGLYVSNFGNYGATYGSLGAIVVLLTWLWLSFYAFLLGASLDVQLYRARTPRHPPADAAAATPTVAAATPAAASPGLLAGVGLTLLGLSLLIVGGRRDGA